MALDRKIAYVDLSSGKIRLQPVPPDIRRLFLGGRGLDMYLLYNHMNPTVDPLSPDNVALVSAGILVGTLAPAAARSYVSGKSPLTGFAGSANVGGFFGPELRWAGFDHLVITGKADRPVYLWVHNGEIEIRDAGNIWGKGASEAEQGVRDELRDRDVQVLAIGPAGEKLVRLANVITGLRDTGGRSGMGALFGSKNLKAVAARGTMDIKIAHPAKALDFNLRAREAGHTLKAPAGTAMDEYSVGTSSCLGCDVSCRIKYTITGGAYAGVYDEAPAEVAEDTFAAKLGSPSLLTVLVANHLANVYGVDLVETGGVISWAMQLYKKGILTDEDTGGLKLWYGNDRAVIEMAHRIAQRKGLGDILAEGLLRAAEKIGRDSASYVNHVKGMSSPDPDQLTPALALAVAVASSGSECTGGYPTVDLPEAALSQICRQPVAYEGQLTADPWDYEGKPWQVLWRETADGAADCLGICRYSFPGAELPDFEEWSKLLYYNTGLEMSALEIWKASERARNIERLFNIREGLTRKDDSLGERYFERLDRVKFQKMLDEYYRHHGWKRDGAPSRQTLKRLGIESEPSHLL